jgi:hypothetical protein
LLEQLSSALGEEWVRRNQPLVDAYWRAVLELGYALPDERPGEDVLEDRIAS